MEWNELVDAGTAFFEERVRLRRPTSYTELNMGLHQRTGQRLFDFSEQSERTAMGHLLALTVERDDPTRGYMLSALVMYLDGNDAGSGFYALAKQPHVPGADGPRDAFWLSQLRGLGIR